MPVTGLTQHRVPYAEPSETTSSRSLVRLTREENILPPSLPKGERKRVVCLEVPRKCELAEGRPDPLCVLPSALSLLCLLDRGNHRQALSFHAVTPGLRSEPSCPRPMQDEMRPGEDFSDRTRKFWVCRVRSSPLLTRGQGPGGQGCLAVTAPLTWDPTAMNPGTFAPSPKQVRGEVNSDGPPGQPGDTDSPQTFCLKASTVRLLKLQARGREPGVCNSALSRLSPRPELKS